MFPRRQVVLSGSLGPQKLHVLLADTPARQRRGLIGKKLRTEHGMFFTWRNDVMRPVHMRGVPEALDVLFFDSRGVLREVKRLDPETGYTSAPGRYLLEVPARMGLVRHMGLMPGQSRIALLAD
jgi:uncharacterized membrane protein (UPF0127 family)